MESWLLFRCFCSFKYLIEKKREKMIFYTFQRDFILVFSFYIENSVKLICSSTATFYKKTQEKSKLQHASKDDRKINGFKAHPAKGLC